MKTTSSRDPNEIMAEIKKVNLEYNFWASKSGFRLTNPDPYFIERN